MSVLGWVLLVSWIGIFYMKFKGYGSTAPAAERQPLNDLFPPNCSCGRCGGLTRSHEYCGICGFKNNAW